ERACVLFDYARRKQLSIERALQDMNWYQGAVAGASNNIEAVDFDTLRSKAEQSFQEGRMEEAEELWLSIVKLSERLGPEHPTYGGDMERLADVYTKAGKLEHAESLYSRSLIAKIRVLPPDSLHTAASMNNLAKVYYFLGRFEEAEHFALKFLE